MKDLLILAYIAERAELLSRVSPPPVDARHAEAFKRLRDHLRELYRVFRSDFGSVTLERIQNLCDIHAGRTPPLRQLSTFEVSEAAEKILAAEFKSGDELKRSVVAELSDLIKARHVAHMARQANEEVARKLQRQVGRVRTPVCWSCHRQLDNRLSAECVACGWIICLCGACDSNCNGRKG